MKNLRWKRYVFLGSVLLFAGMGAWIFTKPRPQISFRTIDQVQFGMTLAEVESLVKAPPGDYAMGSSKVNQVQIKQAHGTSGIGTAPARGIESILSENLLRGVEPQYRPGPSASWTTSKRALFVLLDDQQRVTYLAYGQRSQSAQNWMERCLFWFDSWFEEQQKE